MDQVFETTDLDAAHHILSRTYGAIRMNARGQRHAMRLAQGSLGPVRFDRLSLDMEFTADATPRQALIFGHLESGRVRYCAAGRDTSRREYGTGQVFLVARPEDSYRAAITDIEAQLAVIDPALPSQVADTAPSRAQNPVRFTGYDPVSPQAAKAWKATYAYIRDGLLARQEPEASPLVTAAAARLLVATALATFPNDALTDPTIEDRHDGCPATVRGAVVFIDEHAHQDISLADIAAAAQVTIRAVQLAFRRHMDTTPLAYLRRVRLDHAHRELQAADPERHTVTAIAARWGFGSPSRFAAYYREAYGIQPRHTLHN